MIKLSQKDILLLHRLLSDASGGSAGVRSQALLESALCSPFQTFDGIELYPTVEEKAARLCFSLVSNHAFVDGNKRIGILALFTFLFLNGITISVEENDLVETTLALASGKLDYNNLLLWVRSNII